MQQTSTKGVLDKTKLGRKGRLQGIVQEIEISAYYQMVYAPIRIRPGG